MKIIAKQDSEGEILKQQDELLLRDYERAVASGCFQGTLEEFKEFREVGCWGIVSMNRDGFSDFFQIPNGLGGDANDATIASKVLNIDIKKQTYGYSQTLLMIRFPCNELDNHLTKLIRSGIRVALCE